MGSVYVNRVVDCQTPLSTEAVAGKTVVLTGGKRAYHFQHCFSRPRTNKGWCHSGSSGLGLGFVQAFVEAGFVAPRRMLFRTLSLNLLQRFRG